MSFLTSIRSYVDGLVHPSAHRDLLTASRHRAFIAPRLLASLVALVAFPAYLFLRGAPSLVEAGVLAWLIVPILISYYLSKTGRYESAHILSALALTGLVTVIAWQSGGIGSAAAVWLVVVPLEAALSASRRVVALASLIALSAAGMLLIAASFGLLPAAESFTSHDGAFAALGIISAGLYATGIALGTESLARTSVWMLYAEEDRYRLLARNMTDVITRHGRNGAVLFASPAAEKMFGFAADELLGQGLFDRVHVADRPAYLSTLRAASVDGVPGSVEFRARREREDNGPEFVWIELRCRPLEPNMIVEDGDRQDVVAVLRDVSERKAQEAALEEARAESDRANAGKSRFLATMSHELRTPLNAIIGFSEMLADPQITVTPARQLEYAKLINDSGRHLLSVVNGILDMSKMEAGNFEITPEPFAPGAVIANCCDLLALKAYDSGVDLTYTLPRDLPEIVADRRALSQVLINLVSNAVKFTERGGSVVVAAARDGHHLMITVTDTGVGIDEEDLPRLGEAFFQARASYDRRHDGTGLGLSIVKGLVRLHGGKMDIKSRLHEGTCVTIRLPLDCEGHRPPVSPINFARRTQAVPATVAAPEREKKSA